jgi:arylsulfatase
MDRSVALFTALALTLIGCASDPPLPEPRHLILITVDTLRSDHVGSYGADLDLTPHLDQLASESVRFARAYTPAPYTLPAIVAVMTSRYASEVGIDSNMSRLGAQTTLAEELRKAGFRTGAVVSNFVLRRASGLDRGFDHYDDELPQKEEVRGLRERTAAPTTDAALALLDTLLDGEDPRIFLWVHYQDPHGPYTPPAELRERFLEAERQRPGGRRELPLSSDHRGIGGIPNYQYLEPHREVAFYRAGYAGEVSYFDAELGRLLAALRTRGLDQNSALIFAADHGEGLGEDDYWFAHGEYLNHAAVHVPLMIRTPGLAPGVRDHVVALLDVVPTAARLFGLRLSITPRGTDLLAAPEGERWAYLVTQPPATTLRRAGIVDTDYKLVRTHRSRSEEVVYRMPGEIRLAQTEAREQRTILSRRLDAMYVEPVADPQQQEITDADREALESLGYVD